MCHFMRSTALSFLFDGYDQCGIKAGQFKFVMKTDLRNTYNSVGNTVYVSITSMCKTLRLCPTNLM
jgi:hypothetical protein